jgi:hypothetical protein
MSTSSLNRVGGVVVLLAGISTILFNAALWTGLAPRSLEYPGYLGLQILFLFALVAILIRHAARPGVLLLAGFSLAAVDLLFGVGFSYYASFAFPILRAEFPDAVRAVLNGPVGTISMLSMATGILGNILFYTGAFRARLVPRWAPVVVIFSQVLGVAMLPNNIPVIIACIGLAGIGLSMLAVRPTTVADLKTQPAG